LRRAWGFGTLAMHSVGLRIVTAAALLCVQACGHGLITVPKPRTGTNEAGANKGTITTSVPTGAGAKAPCGTDSTDRGTSVSATYAPGETVTVKWTMGAAHPGDCMIKIVSQANPTR
jgi:hypothetical protein